VSGWAQIQPHCQVALWRALIHSRCNLWEEGEPNLLKLLGVQTFSGASSMTLCSAAPPDRILTRSPQVTACRGRDLAPRLNQSPIKYSATAVKRTAFARNAAPGAWHHAAQARAKAVVSGRREPVNMVQAAEKGCGNRGLSGGSNAFSLLKRCPRLGLRRAIASRARRGRAVPGGGGGDHWGSWMKPTSSPCSQKRWDRILPTPSGLVNRPPRAGRLP
jgi:hypothetical protein